MRNSSRKKFACCLPCGLLVIGPYLYAQDLAPPSIATAEIVTLTSQALACTDYRVVGVCIWLTYEWPAGFSIDTTVKVGHYLPDVVVSSYAQVGQSPWLDSRPIVGAINGLSSAAFRHLMLGFQPGGGNSINYEAAQVDTGKIRFKNADILGHPLASVFTGSDYQCASTATSFEPYFISGADTLAWRFLIPESFYPQALNPLQRNIHKNLSLWGSVYPRSGKILQNHDYKAGAVVAQRAGDVVTRSGQPHIYTSLATSESDVNGQHRWPPGPLIEGDATTGHWQMLLPHRETSCYVFVDREDTTALIADPNADRINSFGGYLWNLWRPYSCCGRPSNAVALITSIGTYP